VRCTLIFKYGLGLKVGQAVRFTKKREAGLKKGKDRYSKTTNLEKRDAAGRR